MLAEMVSRIRALFRRRQLDEELDFELRDHLERLAAEYRRRGMSPGEARHAARRQFGGVAHLEDELRDRRSVPPVETILRDFRYALRSLARSPLFATTAILTLALGIGANTAIFTLLDQALLRVLPVKDPARLVSIVWRGAFIGGSMRGGQTFSYPAYRDLRDGNPGVFTGIAARYQDSVDVTDRGPAERALVELVSGNYFEVLGVAPEIGRTLTPDDDRVRDASPYLVLSDSYWRRRFGADPSILNRTIDVNGHAMTVVGVTQRGFGGYAMMSPSDLFVPMAMKSVVTPDWDHMERRDSDWLRLFARLNPGTALQTAQAAMASPYRTALENDLKSVRRNSAFAQRYLRNTLTLKEAIRGYDHLGEFIARPLYLMMAMVGVLLLITCVNVANLLVSRAASRQREIAIRLSLGATRGALVRLLLMESVALAAAAGTLALAVSYWVSGLLVGAMPFDNIAVAFRTAPDLRVMGFTAIVSFAAALLFGMAPGLQATRAIVPSLAKRPSTKFRKTLVAAEVMLSLLLLMGAGLFARSLHKLMSVDTGIDTADILTFHTDPILHQYDTQRSRRFMLDLENRLRAIPGVVAASCARVAVLSGDGWTNTLHVEGYQPRSGEEMTFLWNAVTPGFFATMGAPLIAGRDFSERDIGEKATVMIVNETFARRFAPNGNAVGLHVGFGVSGPLTAEIIGVVKDMKNADVSEPAKPAHYTSALQERFADVQLYVRTRHDPMRLAGAVRRELARLDPTLPMLDVRTVAAQVDQTHYLDRLFAWLAGAFGLLATLLASIGLYGVTAFAVTRRTQEIGIRVALGAGRGNVLQLVMREVVALTAIGIALGLPLALVLGRYVESQLYQVTARDPLVTAAAVVAIVAVAVVAAYLPARRAARIDPLRALRYE